MRSADQFKPGCPIMIQTTFNSPESPLLSVVIPTHNEADNIERCIASFLQHPSARCNIEVIVVDNASRDSTVQLACSAGAAVFHKGPERSAQRNYGALIKARGRFILFMDADMSMPLETVSELLDRLSDRSPPDIIYVPERFVGAGYWVRLRNWERSFYNLTPVDAFRVVRKDLLTDTGGFDEKQTGTEDWDLDRRLRERTSAFVLLDHPLFHHEPENSMLQTFRKKAYYARHFDAYLKKWGRNDPWVRKQIGFWYRYFMVFIENGKWKRSLLRPDYLLTFWCYKAIVGGLFVCRKWIGNGST